MLLQQPPQSPILDNPVSIVIQKEETKEPVLYTIQKGDNLTKIAEAHNTTVERLWAANPELDHPDLINPSETLKIPENDETLEPRPFPAIIETGLNSTDSPQKTGTGGYSSSGNTYYRGYCTWYAKNKRPDLPNRMGDAISWPSSARAAGFLVNFTPSPGAIGQYGNHVVYVESVNGNGTFNLSEMNYEGFGVVSSRSNVSPSGWQFIH